MRTSRGPRIARSVASAIRTEPRTTTRNALYSPGSFRVATTAPTTANVPIRRAMEIPGRVISPSERSGAHVGPRRRDLRLVHDLVAVTLLGQEQLAVMGK